MKDNFLLKSTLLRTLLAASLIRDTFTKVELWFGKLFDENFIVFYEKFVVTAEPRERNVELFVDVVREFIFNRIKFENRIVHETKHHFNITTTIYKK